MIFSLADIEMLYLFSSLSIAFYFLWKKVGSLWVSNVTKAWIPSVFVTACVMLIGYWTCFPKEIVTMAGLMTASVFAITMYCVQGFAGYPLTAICLQMEDKRLLKKYRSGEVHLTPEQIKEMESIGLTAVADDSHVKKLLPKMPAAYNTGVFMLGLLRSSAK